MSRYPFLEYSDKYMTAMTGYYSEATTKRYSRRFKRIDRDLREEFAQGRISSTSPKTMTPEDVMAHLSYRRSLGLSRSEYGHEVTTLTVLFDFVGNPAVREAMRKYPLLKVSNNRDRLPTLTPEEVSRILDGMDAAIESGRYYLIRSYALVAIYLGCGTRTKEVRLMEAKDIDTDEWLVSILHVKGEDSYGHPRIVPVAPEFRRILLEYLLRRANRTTSDYLFASKRSTALCDNQIRNILRVCSEDCGVSFDGRILRRTFGQRLLDSNIDSIESVSVLMGHSTTSTTELYYARRRNDRAIEEARKLWEKKGENEGLVPGKGFEPLTFGFPWKRSVDQNPMSPTLHQAEPPRP